MYLEDHIYQCDIAKYFKISPALVSKLVKESEKEPKKNIQLKLKEKDEKEKKKAVKKVVEEMLANSVPIVKAEMVVEALLQKENLSLSVVQVRTIMKDDLGLGYRMSRKVPVQGNSERCLVLRQQYAMHMLPLLKEGKRILNLDESWLNESNFTRQIWVPP